MRFEWKRFASQRLITSQQGFDERFELVHASRGLEAFHDVALAVDDELREVPADVAFRALLRLQELVQRDLLVAVHIALRHLRERRAVKQRYAEKQISSIQNAFSLRNHHRLR